MCDAAELLQGLTETAGTVAATVAAVADAQAHMCIGLVDEAAGRCVLGKGPAAGLEVAQAEGISLAASCTRSSVQDGIHATFRVMLTQGDN